jgi:hypothetical protein
VKHLARDTGRKLESRTEKGQKEDTLQQKLRKETIDKLFCCYSTALKIIELSISARSDISVQVQLFETRAENFSEQSDLLSQESSVPSVPSAVDSNPEFNIEQQVLSYNIVSV